MHLKRLLPAMPILAIALMGSGCQHQTIRDSSAILDKAVCEAADHYRFKPYRQTWPKLTAEEQAFLLGRLSDYRAENCPEILGEK